MCSSEQGDGHAAQVPASALGYHLTFPQSLPKLENFNKESKLPQRYFKKGVAMSSLQRSPKTPGLWSTVWREGRAELGGNRHFGPS